MDAEEEDEWMKMMEEDGLTDIPVHTQPPPKHSVKTINQKKTMKPKLSPKIDDSLTVVITTTDNCIKFNYFRQAISLIIPDITTILPDKTESRDNTVRTNIVKFLNCVGVYIKHYRTHKNNQQITLNQLINQPDLIRRMCEFVTCLQNADNFDNFMSLSQDSLEFLSVFSNMGHNDIYGVFKLFITLIFVVRETYKHFRPEIPMIHRDKLIGFILSNETITPKFYKSQSPEIQQILDQLFRLPSNISRQRYFEILTIIDSASDVNDPRGTYEFISEVCKFVSQFIVLQPWNVVCTYNIIRSCANYGVSVSRNLGFKYARNSYIMFSDDDDWRAHVIELFYELDWLLSTNIMHQTDPSKFVRINTGTSTLTPRLTDFPSDYTNSNYGMWECIFCKNTAMLEQFHNTLCGTGNEDHFFMNSAPFAAYKEIRQPRVFYPYLMLDATGSAYNNGDTIDYELHDIPTDIIGRVRSLRVKNDDVPEKFIYTDETITSMNNPRSKLTTYSGIWRRQNAFAPEHKCKHRSPTSVVEIRLMSGDTTFSTIIPYKLPLTIEDIQKSEKIPPIMFIGTPDDAITVVMKSLFSVRYFHDKTMSDTSIDKIVRCKITPITRAIATFNILPAEVIAIGKDDRKPYILENFTEISRLFDNSLNAATRNGTVTEYNMNVEGIYVKFSTCIRNGVGTDIWKISLSEKSVREYSIYMTTPRYWKQLMETDIENAFLVNIDGLSMEAEHDTTMDCRLPYVQLWHDAFFGGSGEDGEWQNLLWILLMVTVVVLIVAAIIRYIGRTRDRETNRYVFRRRSPFDLATRA